MSLAESERAKQQRDGNDARSGHVVVLGTGSTNRPARFWINHSANGLLLVSSDFSALLFVSGLAPSARFDRFIIGEIFLFFFFFF